jgi:hypothetical protein
MLSCAELDSALEHFAHGVDQETEPDLAIPPKTGVERMAAHNRSPQDQGISKNALKNPNFM